LDLSYLGCVREPASKLARTGTTWTKVQDYVCLDGRPLAQIEYPTATTTYNYYLHTDHIGLPRAMTNQAGQLVWNTYARPFGDVAEKTMVDPLSGRTVVTNLRLPGQYDERLLGSVGLQGPYYNWNRWYLPGVGRYLELDPIALRGGRNGPHGPDWYGYGYGNPLRYDDPTGLIPISPSLAGEVCAWIAEMITEGGVGGLGSAVCATRACKSKSKRDYFEAFGDCLHILVRILNAPTGPGHSPDAYASACARSCRDVTKSSLFGERCLACGSR